MTVMETIPPLIRPWMEEEEEAGSQITEADLLGPACEA